MMITVPEDKKAAGNLRNGGNEMRYHLGGDIARM